MQLDITFKNIDPTDALKDYASKRLSKLDKYIDKPSEVHVVLSVEKRRHKADVTLSADGVVINKTGSAALACCAHALNVPVYILAERRKLVPAERATHLEQGAASEVWDAPPAGVTVENLVFERVPSTYIRGVILEDGVWGPGDMAQKCCEFQENTCR